MTDTATKYRLLDESDTIQRSDQFLSDDTTYWESIPPDKGTIGEVWMVGAKWNPRGFKPMRREIPGENASGHTSQPPK